MAEITEEELRRMSPEQILQLQKQNCVFCQIIGGRIPAKKVYETPTLVGLLDINPASPGHVILLTKEHFQIMPLIPDDLIGDLFVSAKLISQTMLKTLKSQGTTVFAANGTVAGQRAPHFMLHIIPRTEGDTVNITIPELNADHSSVLNILSGKIREIFGSSSVEAEFEDIESKAEKKPEEKKAERKEIEESKVAHKKSKDDQEDKEHKESEKKEDPEKPGKVIIKEKKEPKVDNFPEKEDKEDREKESTEINLDELTDFMFKGPK